MNFYLIALLRYLSFLLFVLVISGCQKQDDVPKHIFFIVIDTLRADHLGCYGYKAPTSPTIDRLANEGIVLTHAFSTASSTLESVISFFNSTTALTNKVHNLNPPEALPLSKSSLQKHLKESGYNTLAVISNPWLKYHQDYFKDGFEHFQFVISDYWKQKGIYNTTDEVTQTALNFLKIKFQPNEKNFFFIHYLDPHGPYRSPVDYNFFSGIPPARPLKVHALSGERKVLQKYKKDPTYTPLPTPKHVTENELNYLIARYDSEIRHVDSNLEKLLSRLQEMNILNESLIIITADHGEEFLEHGCLKHGFHLYDESIHIPLIFYWKDHLKAERRENLVSGIDIAPTILEICQIKPPKDMLGSNIFKQSKEREPVVFCTHFINQEQFGIRTAKWKVIKNARTGEINIFDLEDDPEEKKNLFNSDPGHWNHLLSTFDKVLEAHVSKEYEKKGGKLVIDPETKEQLKALGYM